jgi:hypothetical protein
MNRRDAQLSSNRMGFMGSIGAAIVCQELQTFRTGIDVAESRFDGFDQHFTYWLAGQTPSRQSTPRNDLAITAVFGECTRDGLAILTVNLEAVGAPARVRFQHGNTALVGLSQPCTGLLQLDEFEPEFARWGMRTEVVERGG